MRVTTPSGMVLSADGIHLHYEYRSVRDDVRAGLVLAHGYADHSGRYEALVGRLVTEGYGVLLFDFRGHGRSEGKRGHCNAFGEYLSDLQQAVALCQTSAPAKPIGIIAQSFGALVTLALLTDADRPTSERAPEIAAAVLCSPFIGRAIRGSPLMEAIARVASRLWPRFTASSGLNGSMLSHDDRAAQAYENDPLVHHVTTARWFTEAERAQARVASSVQRIEAPTLWLVPTSDAVADSATTQEVFRRAGGDKRLVLFEDMYHELWNEPQSDRAYAELSSWLQQHIEGTTGPS
jgi:alpha-beta hydrolase superfamily lysophospholipase